MVSFAPLRGEMRGYLVKAVARLRLPGSAPAPMWQEAHASLLFMCLIFGSGTSGPRYSEVCAIRRLPYSSVAPAAVRIGRPGVAETLPNASVPAIEISPRRA